MKKSIALILALVLMLLHLSGAFAEADKLIYVLTPESDCGWLGEACKNAQEKCDAVNAEGRYECVCMFSAGAEEQLAQIEEIITGDAGESVVGVVVLPWNAAVEEAITGLTAAGIHYAGVNLNDISAANAVFVTGSDRVETGAIAARCLVENGMREGDKCVVFEGEDAAAAFAYSEGFMLYLIGAQAIDDEYIAEPWSSLDTVTFSGALNNSRTDAQQFFEAYMSDAANADTRYLAAWNDACVIGVMDALEGSAINADTRVGFLGNGPYIVGVGGDGTVCNFIRGESAEYTASVSGFAGIMDIVCPPEIMGEAVLAIADYLDGEPVLQANIVSAQIITAENVNTY